jgi:hypothetical protein
MIDLMIKKNFYTKKINDFYLRFSVLCKFHFIKMISLFRLRKLTKFDIDTK